jgi:hypothetical protein
MSNPKRRVIVLWQPLAMIIAATILLLIAQPAEPPIKIAAAIFAGLLMISAGTAFVVGLKNNLKA